MIRPLCALILLQVGWFALSPIYAQMQVRPVADEEGYAGLGLVLRKLDTVGAFMMATAHPDDETNALLALLTGRASAPRWFQHLAATVARTRPVRSYSMRRRSCGLRSCLRHIDSTVPSSTSHVRWISVTPSASRKRSSDGVARRFLVTLSE